MNFRIAILLAVLCPLAAYAAFVLGRSGVPECIMHRDLNYIECPEAPDTEGCDIDGEMYTTEMRWLKPVPNIPLAYVECDEEDPAAEHKLVILKTEIACGFPGRYVEKEENDFGTKPIDNENNLVMRGEKADCYREYNCEWVVTLPHYQGFATAEYNSEGYYQPKDVWQKKCKAYEVSTTMITGLTWKGANWTDCFGGSE